MISRILKSSKSVPQTDYYRLLRNINVTEQICLEAVKKDGDLLRVVPGHLRTKKVCLEAVKQNGNALCWVPYYFRTYKLCLEAVKQTRLALDFFPSDFRYEYIIQNQQGDPCL